MEIPKLERRAKKWNRGFSQHRRDHLKIRPLGASDLSPDGLNI